MDSESYGALYPGIQRTCISMTFCWQGWCCQWAREPWTLGSIYLGGHGLREPWTQLPRDIEIQWRCVAKDDVRTSHIFSRGVTSRQFKVSLIRYSLITMLLYILFKHVVLSGASALHAWCILFPSLLQQHISALNSVTTLQELRKL